MLDGLVSLVAEEHSDLSGTGWRGEAHRQLAGRLTPFGIYPCLDGLVAIAAFTLAWMEALLDAMGRPELLHDARFSTRGPRMQHASALNRIIEAWTGSLNTEDVVRELFEKRGVMATRVRTPIEALHDPESEARGAVVKLVHPQLGDLQAFGIGNPIQFSNAYAQFDDPCAQSRDCVLLHFRLRPGRALPGSLGAGHRSSGRKRNGQRHG